MIERINRLFASAIRATVQRGIARLLRATACGIGAAACLVGVMVFLIMAGYFGLRLHYPPVEAALFMAAALLVLAIVCVVLLFLSGRPRRPSRKQATIAEEVAPLVDILKAAGCDREAAGLLAGSQLAAQMRPYSLVVTALVVGLILGRKFGPHAPPDQSRPS